MNNNDFKFSPTQVTLDCKNMFEGTQKDRKILEEVIKEWNERISISQLCEKWSKVRPVHSSENLLFVLYNCECLRTHLPDIDLILNEFTPHLIILTGVG